jgi:hypothetical protein
VVNATLVYPRERHLVPIVQEAGWAPGPVWMVLKILPPLGVNPWTVQLLESHYTSYPIIALISYPKNKKFVAYANYKMIEIILKHFPFWDVIHCLLVIKTQCLGTNSTSIFRCQKRTYKVTENGLL